MKTRTPQKQTKKALGLPQDVSRSNYEARWREQRISMLSFIADTCTALTAEGVSEKEFLDVVNYCKQANIIDDGKLAALGGVEKSSANRWIHAKTAPRSSVLRRVILQGLLEDMNARVALLKQGKNEPGLGRG